ncbi:hypothetical protein FJT64_013991 [Amphibalanus amphitrite]|uniref:Uncharacterized protein n=1 Tax=Amphibalanus amphitrite TaxID=1232801 RepID=A0A6A4V7R3_AMPAM|nr:hypothetical protein FJT64_013991 [Amphibalanus amphitrite]
MTTPHGLAVDTLLRLMGEEHLMMKEGDGRPMTSMPVLEDGEVATLHVREGTPVAKEYKQAMLLLWCSAFYIFNIKTTQKSKNTN